ncbi:MAG: ATP-binding protein [Coriobacteriales bacterium]|nr:ATP-binding protein [Coriobacteriales bacterium]
MAQDFYPFVENGEASQVGEGTVRHAARIAVYDDAAAAPRVVVVEPQEIRPYLEEITRVVTQLAKEQGGTIPFMVIREIVENLIHAYFMEPTISILDGGNTIRFSDQGPGITNKDLALQYGTTSATEEMKRYIRGVGSGLPYAQQYMRDKGGSLRIDDNLSGGTVVTISALPESPDATQPMPMPVPYPGSPQAQQGWPGAPQTQQGWPAAQAGWQAQQGWQTPQGYAMQSPAWQQAPQGYAAPAPAWQQMPQQTWQAPAAGAPFAGDPAQQTPTPQQASAQPQAELPQMRLDERASAVLSYLARHDVVGPTELTRAYGESGPTWSRVLQKLEEQGIVRKDGQKRRLTVLGRTYLERQGAYLP